jgi:hypothetical protein
MRKGSVVYRAGPIRPIPLHPEVESAIGLHARETDLISVLGDISDRKVRFPGKLGHILAPNAGGRRRGLRTGYRDPVCFRG